MRKANIEIPFKITEQTGRKKPITDDGICTLVIGSFCGYMDFW